MSGVSIGLVLFVALTLQFLVQRPKKPELVVRGRVTDGQGQPLARVRIQARLGLDLEGPSVFSDNQGQFLATAKARDWFKSSPSLSAQAAGFREKVVYFDRWYRGRQEFTRDVVLMRPDNRPPNQTLQRTAKSTRPLNSGR